MAFVSAPLPARAAAAARQPATPVMTARPGRAAATAAAAAAAVLLATSLPSLAAISSAPCVAGEGAGCAEVAEENPLVKRLQEQSRKNKDVNDQAMLEQYWKKGYARGGGGLEVPRGLLLGRGGETREGDRRRGRSRGGWGRGGVAWGGLERTVCMRGVMATACGGVGAVCVVRAWGGGLSAACAGRPMLTPGLACVLWLVFLVLAHAWRRLPPSTRWLPSAAAPAVDGTPLRPYPFYL
ncbi:hypothetical protein I4F81_007745 [Pyropia yezoensis]|uniref:Uncharacterized protein n=1 Tax=Pyropia yezoensis TaxID=2788 RepID=A0ACC3C5G2_PYRYE|nr:hypothetical protein I4F81_007745 [Neopyropia yezoensis]